MTYNLQEDIEETKKGTSMAQDEESVLKKSIDELKLEI